MLKNQIQLFSNCRNRKYYRYKLQHDLKVHLASEFQHCEYKEFDTDNHRAPILSLHIDKSEKRYLLASSTDCIITIHDTNHHDNNNNNNVVRPMAIIPSNHQYTHKYSITCVQWYTHDTGMFISSSLDKYVKIWDTNELQVACQYYMSNKIYMFDQSPISVQHATIAVASAHPHVRLIDMKSGSTAQTLVGHKSDVLCVRWSPSNQYILATGSKDQCIKLWDIRKAGWLHSYDMFHTKRSTTATTSMQQQQQQPIHVFNRKFTTDKLRSDTRTAPSHNGSITDLEFTPDGIYLLSSGTDNQVRKWHVQSGENTLVTYPNISNTADTMHHNFVLDQTGTIMYHANGSQIGVYNVESGASIGMLMGHFGRVNSMVFHPQEQELYSTGSDHQIFIWSPKYYHEQRKSSSNLLGKIRQPAVAVDQDEWSSDEEDVRPVGFT
jgi:DNA excision repair protein ERCC-8